MKVLIHDTPAAAEARAAALIAAQLRQAPASVLGLATGGTMLPVYAELCRMHREEGLSFAQATSFNLDEYVGLTPDHPASYHHYMRRALFDHIDIDPANTHLPRGDAADPAAACAAYEARIAAAGGIDLQLLGIGRNGHIGFNEPTSSLGSRTRMTALAASTLAANSPYFTDGTPMPRHALTMGIATILDAKACLLLATGAAKASAVARMIEGPLAAVCPASALQLHPDVTVVLDKDAAQELVLQEFYQRDTAPQHD